jgi:hypothetical protein
VSTEQFHAEMFEHWSKALEAHRREIAEKGLTIERRLTLERLESLVRHNAPESENDS